MLRRPVIRISLLARYGLISLVVIAALGVVLNVALRATLIDRTLDDARRAAVIAATTGIQPLLSPQDLTRDFVPLTPERVAELDRALSGVITPDGIVRVKLWNRQNWIVYSDNVALRGRWFPGPELLKQSLEGEVTSEVTDLTAPDEFEEEDFGELLAVYVPLAVEGDPATATQFSPEGRGQVIGSFEIYLPYAPLAAQIREESQRLSLVLALGLALLWGVLFRLVQRASRRLTAQAKANQYLAEHDTLTGLVNRSVFARSVGQRLEGAAGGAVALVDLQRFQDVNDTLGHSTGDALLCKVAERLADRMDDGEILARMGGDEFGLFLPAATSPVGARSRMTELLAAFDAPIDVGDLGVEVDATTGVALLTDDLDVSNRREAALAAEQLLQQADIALYQAKFDHTPVGVYDPARNHFTRERLALATQVREALDSDQIELVFQPQLNLRTGRVHSVEALVRWRHPERGVLAPGAFMEVVEQTDLVRQLTARVLEIALRQVRTWHGQGMRVRMSVNLSARDCTNPLLPSLVAAALARHDLTADALTLELTESAMLTNPTTAEAVLHELAAMGIEIAIDDFGTGYASLAYVRRMPISELKIDRSFVQGLHSGGPDADVVRFTIDLAHRMHLRSVAEGVETQADIDALSALGCHVLQGYEIARPMEADAATAWLHGAPTVPSTGVVPTRADQVRSLVAAEVSS